MVKTLTDLYPIEKIRGPSFRKANWNFNWTNTTIVMLPPLICLCGLIYGVPLVANTVYLGLIFYVINGLSITLGYHRLFSHKAF